MISVISNDIDALHSKVLDPTSASLAPDAQLDLLEETSRHIRGGLARLEKIRIPDTEVQEKKTALIQKLHNVEDELIVLYADVLPNIPLRPIPLDACKYHNAVLLGVCSSLSLAYAYEAPIDKHDDITQVLSILAVICNVIMGLASDPCDFILGVGILLVKLAMSTVSGISTTTDEQGTYNRRQELMLERLPGTLQEALQRFDIEGRFELYATCPQCNFTNKRKHSGTFPDLCQQSILTETRSSVCGTSLLRPRRDGTLQPIKPYLVGSFHDHLARTLADPIFLQQSTHATDEALKTARSGETPSLTSNIFLGDFMQNFKGSDGKLFVDRGDKIRLAYALHMDFFNPKGTRQRGNHNSIGIISAANLALDTSIRYLPEYLFVGGVIPGPKEPTLEESDHFVRPIIEQFASAWSPGIHVSRTASSPSGAVVESAIVLSVNDLPAARKIAGMQGVSSDHICSVCRLYGKAQVMNTNFHQWIPRDVDDLREQAEAWRDAATLKQRKDIYDRSGIRWSSLWLLPYWDPTKMLVVDSMHCLLEGLIHYHCRHVLRLDATGSKASDDGYRYAFSFPWQQYDPDGVPQRDRIPQKNIGQVRNIQKTLCLALEGEKSLDLSGVWKRLNGYTLPALKFVASSLRLSNTLHPKAAVLATWHRMAPKKNPGAQFPEVIEVKSKAHIIASLLNWVSMLNCIASISH